MSLTKPEAERAQSRLLANQVTLRYDKRVVSQNLSVSIPDGSFTTIVGPNACGKSTLLRSLARLLVPADGQIILDGRAIAEYPPKEVARRVGLLPQTSVAPDGITVADLVGRGRYPHQSFFRQRTRADDEAVEQAMQATGVLELAERPVDQLSGGQRQRVWVSMALAQDTPILLLDEPTTYLDITHQIELLDLFAALHAQGRTIVAVLHDLNQAARYATHIIAMKAGRMVAEGPRARWSPPPEWRRSSPCRAWSSMTRSQAPRWWCPRAARTASGLRRARRSRGSR